MPSSARILAWAAIIAGGAIGSSCQKGGNLETSSFTNIDSQGGVDITINQFSVEIDSSVHFEFYHETNSDGMSSTTMTLDGHPYGVRNGVFFIGDRDYGPLKEESVVKVSAKGVLIDGEMRGPLP